MELASGWRCIAVGTAIGYVLSHERSPELFWCPESWRKATAVVAVGAAVRYLLLHAGGLPVPGKPASKTFGKSASLLPSQLNRRLEAEGRASEALAELRALTAGLTDHGSSTTAESAPFTVPFPRRRELTESELTEFRREGLVICRGWFTSDEVDVLRGAIEADREIDVGKISVKDTVGRDTKLALWWYLGDDTFGQVGRSASLVGAASVLMGGAEPYHSHTKVLLKEPRAGGAWEWHQDFGYWYDQGVLHPDKIVNAIIAVDENTAENGCMRLMRKSHTLGRIDHGTFGGQAGADPTKVVAAMALPGHEVVTLPLQPGDIAFMHSNTLHCSAAVSFHILSRTHRHAP